MELEGTRPGYNIWLDTSSKQLMKGEAYAWKYASQYVDYLDSYFVPIELDQRYPDRVKESQFDEGKKEDSDEDKKDQVDQAEDERPKLDPTQTVRKRRCCCPFKFLPFCGKSIRYKTTEHIMTYEFGDKETLPTIVLIHGFAGSALLFYPLFKYLFGRYHVLGIDLLGFGCSSRPEFLANSAKEAALFFTESIEAWRIEMGLEKMTLVCHSLGSYIGIKYSHMYPQNIDKLVLLSPLGLQRDLSGSAKTFRRADTDSQCIRKYMYALARCLLKNHGSPADVLRLVGKRISTWLIDDYITRRLYLNEKDKNSLFQYLYQMGVGGRSGELVIGRIIELSLSAFEPTLDQLIDLKNYGIKCVIGFGETDFCNTKFSDRPVSEDLIEQGFDVTIIEGATHQVFFDKPEICTEIIDKILDQDLKQEQQMQFEI